MTINNFVHYFPNIQQLLHNYFSLTQLTALAFNVGLLFFHNYSKKDRYNPAIFYWWRHYYLVHSDSCTLASLVSRGIKPQRILEGAMNSRMKPQQEHHYFSFPLLQTSRLSSMFIHLCRWSWREQGFWLLALLFAMWNLLDVSQHGKKLKIKVTPSHMLPHHTHHFLVYCQCGCVAEQNLTFWAACATCPFNGFVHPIMIILSRACLFFTMSHSTV